MFNFFKKNKSTEKTESEDQNKAEPLYERLSRSRSGWGGKLAALFGMGRKIDDDLLEDLETQLITADLGVQTSTRIIQSLSEQLGRKTLKDGQALYQNLREQLAGLLKDVEQPLEPVAQEGPFVILVIGINGAGKTTTIGKLAHHYLDQNKRVMLAAGDTFRAAAVEQLKTWGERNQVPVIAQQTGADSASVIYDALASAQAKKMDILIADTAGRLHTQDNLMDELKKIKRVMQKLNPDAPHETLLVLDGGTGQNALSQARQFHEAMNLTGLAITKLDGTAKGGIVFTLADELKLPIRFIGVGESKHDLRVFNAAAFVEALLPEFSDSEPKPLDKAELTDA